MLEEIIIVRSSRRWPPNDFHICCFDVNTSVAIVFREVGFFK